MNLDFMEVLRSDELTHVLRIISSLKSSLREPVKILEIDAGAGWQARCLSEVGYSVEAIDIAESEYYGAACLARSGNMMGLTYPFQINILILYTVQTSWSTFRSCPNSRRRCNECFGRTVLLFICAERDVADMDECNALSKCVEKTLKLSP